MSRKAALIMSSPVLFQLAAAGMVRANARQSSNNGITGRMTLNSMDEPSMPLLTVVCTLNVLASIFGFDARYLAAYQRIVNRVSVGVTVFIHEVSFP